MSNSKAIEPIIARIHSNKKGYFATFSDSHGNVPEVLSGTTKLFNEVDDLKYHVRNSLYPLHAKAKKLTFVHEEQPVVEVPMESKLKTLPLVKKEAVAVSTNIIGVSVNADNMVKLQFNRRLNSESLTVSLESLERALSAARQFAKQNKVV